MNPEHEPGEQKPANQEPNPSFIEGELTDDELRQVTGGGPRWRRPPVNTNGNK